MFSVNMFTFSRVSFLILVIFVFGKSDAAPKVNLLRPCRSPDCLKNSIQAALPRFIKGIPELDIESLDPHVIKNLTLVLPGDLRVQFIDGTSRGLKKCVVDTARIIGDTVDLQIHCNFTLKGKYRSSGQLLMFAINGQGNSMIKCRNIKIQARIKLGSTTGADGQKYLEVRGIKTRHSFDGQVFYRIENLIHGNPQISAAVVDFMNQNWKLVADEFGTPIVDFGVATVLKNIKKFFQAVPMDQFAPSIIV